MGQMSMFGAGDARGNSPAADVLPNFEEFPSAELLKFEKELLGFYVTNHPLTEHAAALGNYSTATTRGIKTMPEGAEVTLGGLISRIKRAMTRTGRSAGQPMCIVTLEDLDGQIEATIFAESLAEIARKYPRAIAAEQIVFIRGKVDKRRETPGVIVNELVPIAEAMSRFTRCVKVEIDRVEGAIETLRQLKSVLGKHQGNCQTFLSVPALGEKRALIVLDKQWSIRATPQLKEELEFVLNGQGRVELAGDGAKRPQAVQPPLFQGAQTSEPPEEIPVMSSSADEADVL
jgi:DNA polymerase-3 subunit alpha